MTIKAKLIEAQNHTDLDNQINKFLEQNGLETLGYFTLHYAVDKNKNRPYTALIEYGG